MNNTLFRKASIDRISSPEQMDAYIKVSSPGIWVILTALCACVVTVFIWSRIGSLPTSVSVNGVMDNGQAVCYLSIEDAAKVKAGQTVKVQVSGKSLHFDGIVSEIGSTPLSTTEVAEDLNSDYLYDTLITDKYSVRANIAVSRSNIADGTITSLKIIIDEKKPFYFLNG